MKASYAVNGQPDNANTNAKNNNNIHQHEKKWANTDNNQSPETGRFRRLLPQVLASTAKNLLLLDLGLAVGFPTVVIPALTGVNSSTKGVSEILHFSAEQASWFGSIAFICQPIGSILSGWVSEPIGRKRAMILVNIPHIIAWIMLHFAKSLEEMYFAAILLGLGVGFMEAPIVTYVGEICEPSIRGILTSCAGVAATLGFFLIYLLGTVTTWRNVAIICLSVPIFTMIAISFVPETPLWLLSKNRDKQALKSLQWLRGWVSPDVVSKEFDEMKRYSVQSNSCTPCEKAKNICTHPPATMKEKFAELIRKRTLKPFFLVLSCFFFSQFSGLSAMRPYLVQIFKVFETPIDPQYGAVGVGLMGLIANIVCMSIVKLTGKRKIALVSLVGTATSCLALGFYAYSALPKSWSSFDIHEIDDKNSTHILPVILLFSLSFFTSVGISTVPWMLLSEVFPFKSRGVASGITAASNYIMTFITTKTYLNLERGLSIYGVLWFYGIIGVIGVVYIYFMLPETESRTLEEIEFHFSDNVRKLTSLKIEKIDKTNPSHRLSEINGDTEGQKQLTTENGRSRNRGCDNEAFEGHI